MAKTPGCWASKKNIEPAFAFGYGLSYTAFQYTNLTIVQPALTIADTLVASVQVRNTGARAGAEVVQLYIGFGQGGAADRPKKLLRGFEKVSLQPGEQRTVQFRLPVTELARYDPSGQQWLVDTGAYTVLIGGSSRQSDLLNQSFEVRQKTILK